MNSISLEMLYEQKKKSSLIAYLIACIGAPLGLQFLYIGGEQKDNCYFMLVILAFVLVSQGNVGNPLTLFLYAVLCVVSFILTKKALDLRNKEILEEVYREFK